MGELLKKLTTRNFIAVSLTSTLIYAIYKSLNSPELVQVALDNPMVTFIIGTFTSGVTTILYFYFRKPQSKETKE